MHGVKTLGSSVNVFHILLRAISGICSVPFPNLRPFYAWLALIWLKVVLTLLIQHYSEEFISASPKMDIMRSQLLGSHHIIRIIKRDSNPPHTCMPTSAFVAHSLSIFQRTLKWRIGASIHCIISWFDAPCMTAHDCTSLSKEFANYLYEQN